MDVLNNQWFIGIASSIISGFIIFYITKKFFSNKENREYDQKVNTANNEILYSLRPLIVQRQVPSQKIINSILNAIAKKYNVATSDLFSIPILVDIMTNEILSNPFLDSTQKLGLCDIIAKMREDEIIKPKTEEIKHLISSRTLSSNYLSVLMSLMTFMTGLSVTYYLRDNVFKGEGKPIDLIQIIIITTLIPAVAITFTFMLKTIRDNKEKIAIVKSNKIIISKDDIDHAA